MNYIPEDILYYISTYNNKKDNKSLAFINWDFYFKLWDIVGVNSCLCDDDYDVYDVGFIDNDFVVPTRSSVKKNKRFCCSTLEPNNMCDYCWNFYN